MKKIAIIGISGKLGQYMLQHALERGYQVNGVCRPQSVHKLDAYKDRITLFPGRTDDADVVAEAVRGCDGVLTVMVPWGVQDYATGTARAVLDSAEPGARLIFSCGWHITLDGQDVYDWKLRYLVPVFARIARLLRFADISDQVRAFDMIFASDTNWTAVRGSDLEEGESQGLPIWREHVGDPALASNITRRTDFGLFMVDTLTNDALIRKAPAIVSCKAPSAIAAAQSGASSGSAPDPA